MIPLEPLLLFAATALAMAITPGPNMLYLVSRSLSQGPRAGVVSLFGVVAAFLVHMTAAATGLTALFLAVPLAYEALKYAGAAYLLHLAWQSVKPGARSPLEPQALPPHSDARLFQMGFLTCVLNPKAALLYLSILPQFVDPDRGPVFVQSVLLGGVQIVISFVCNLAAALSAGHLATRLSRRPRWLATQRWCTGTVLGGLAVRMALEPRRLL